MKFSMPSKGLIATGLLVGAAVGAWAGQRSREYVRRGEIPRLIDWADARRLAVRMNSQSRMSSASRMSYATDYQRLVDESVPVVAEYTGMELPNELNAVYCFDRVDWIDANVRNFEALFAPIEELNPLRESKSPGTFNIAWGTVNQRILTAEVGFLLGYLARRVLGQYDMTLLGREPVESGKLYFVHPNIERVEKALRLPSNDFRLWLALHEVTHAFEFEGTPWLREYFNSLLHEYISLLNRDAEHLKRGIDGLKIFWRRARNGETITGNWFEYVMNPEQRALFARVQALMSVVEGYSNHVMNAVGRELIPTYEVISKRFERRLQQRTFAEIMIARITGLDVKMEQYRKGEAFINAACDAGGHDLAKRVWEGPDMLPSLDEIEHPERWIARVKNAPSS